MVALKRAPASTSLSTSAESRNETSTPRMVTVWAPARPMALPKKPAMMAPASGARGTASSRFWESCAAMLFYRSLASALERVELFDIDRGAVAEQHHQDRQADG